MNKEAMKVIKGMISDKSSPFNKDESFPKEYFLIPKNLPFALGLVLHHPQSSTIGLSKEQIDILMKMKKESKPAILKKAKEIRDMELSLLSMLETNEGSKDKVTKEMSELVDKIASAKAELTKAHLQCVIDVQNVLTKEQREKAISLVSNKKKDIYVQNKDIASKGMKYAKGLIDSLKPSLMESLKKDKSGLKGMEMCSSVAMKMTESYNQIFPKVPKVRKNRHKIPESGE